MIAGSPYHDLVTEDVSDRLLLVSQGNSTLPFAQVLLADGTHQNVSCAYQVLEWFSADDGSRYGTKFLMLRLPGKGPDDALAGVLPTAFEVTAVAADSRMRWASGGDCQFAQQSL